jgi:hypothetical protein
LVKPLTVTGLALPVDLSDAVPATHVALYDVILAPPLDTGAVKAIDALPFAGVAAPIVGAPGTVAGAEVVAEPPPPHAVNAMTVVAAKNIPNFGLNDMFLSPVIAFWPVLWNWVWVRL